MSTKTPIVIETSSRYVRVGFAGENAPRTVFAAIVDNVRPIVDGAVNSWDGWTKLVERAYARLAVDPREHPTLFIDVPLTPKLDREEMTKRAFDTFDIPKMYVASNANLALYDSKRVTGLVVHSEADITYVVPVNQGYALAHATAKLGIPKSGLADFEVVEAMFQPSLVGLSQTGLHECIYNSIMKCDVNLRKDLYANIVVAGENMLDSEIIDRIQHEISQLAPPTMKITPFHPSEAEIAVWRGGASLASLPHFGQLCVTTHEYRTLGAAVVHRKCY